ncbi:MAG TPA: SUF system Fe-S cluster assembly regulator [Thermoanaerobaculia bacterium]|nr:SUF system Fe-S cluster assembly regulator [Thermoanaerobaculia bacterium]
MIRMSKLTDYAILILAHLARSPGTLTAHELAARSRVPVPTVSKLAKELSKAGLVVSHRGRNGGYGLARPADAISVAEIVEALEGPIALTECARPGGAAGCEIEDTCLARESWDPVSRAIETALRGLPLSSIAPYRAGDEPAAPVRIGAPAAPAATLASLVPGGRP